MKEDSNPQARGLGDGAFGGPRENGTNAISRPVEFLPFDERKAVKIYQRNLPHWRQAGCTYFVTFRLADSIPNGVRRQWEYEQTMWLRARGIQYDGSRGSWRGQLCELSRQEGYQFEKHFNRKVQACLDRGLGECWLKEIPCIDAIRSELLKADAKRHHVGDFVIMPNHVHLLTTLIAGYELETILKSIKGKAAIECNKYLQRSGKVWQSESYDHIVRDLDQLVAYREYIAGNPKRAALDLPNEATYRAKWLDTCLKPHS